MPNKNKNISLPSEFELIQKIEDLLSDSDPDVILGVGDDAAVVKPRLGLQTVLTTDTFVEGVDFNVNFSSWWQIGWKCMAANFSDIAAMGGSPRHTLVTLCLPVQRIYKEILEREDFSRDVQLIEIISKMTSGRSNIGELWLVVI